MIFICIFRIFFGNKHSYLCLFSSLSPSVSSVNMSDLQADVLGKHERGDTDDDDASVEKQPKVEESDDDFGPMPLPASEAPSGKKKKRKGTGILFPDYC